MVVAAYCSLLTSLYKSVCTDEFGKVKNVITHNDVVVMQLSYFMLQITRNLFILLKKHHLIHSGYRRRQIKVRYK